MDNDRTRPFLLEPVYHGAPTSCTQKYFNSKLKQYRKDHPEFDEYLINVKNEIKNRELTYCKNILSFLDCEAIANWITPVRSFFRMFIKFYNYDFSAKQTVDYIEKCHDVYEFLMNNKYKLSKDYKIYSKSCTWDNNTRDFIELSLDPVNQSDDWDDYFWVTINFCSLQIVDLDKNHFCDTEIKIRSGRDIYDDALTLFDLYQGCKFLHKCLDTAISELIKHRIINKPDKVINSFTTALFYKINKPHCFKVGSKKYN